MTTRRWGNVRTILAYYISRHLRLKLPAIAFYAVAKRKHQHETRVKHLTKQWKIYFEETDE